MIEQKKIIRGEEKIYSDWEKVRMKETKRSKIKKKTEKMVETEREREIKQTEMKNRDKDRGKSI